MRHALKPLLVAALAVAAVGTYAIWRSFDSTVALASRPSERHPQTTWAACNRNARRHEPSTFQPLSDRAAASLVTREPESRRYNARPYRVNGKAFPSVNRYVPTSVELARFRSSRLGDGRTTVQFNPYFRFVDGRDGLSNPSTDELIQWAAHKW